MPKKGCVCAKYHIVYVVRRILIATWSTFTDTHLGIHISLYGSLLLVAKLTCIHTHNTMTENHNLRICNDMQNYSLCLKLKINYNRGLSFHFL